MASFAGPIPEILLVANAKMLKEFGALQVLAFDLVAFDTPGLFARKSLVCSLCLNERSLEVSISSIPNAAPSD